MVDQLSPIDGASGHIVTQMTLESWPSGSRSDSALITSWNSREDGSTECCIHDAVETQARSNPNSVAVQAWDGSLTYAELDLASSRLASHLISIGVQSQEFVLFLHEKCRWAPVVITAVLKAGAVCVPLDPSDAHRRLESVLSDTKARYAVTSHDLSNLLHDVGVRVIVASVGLMQKDEPSEVLFQRPRISSRDTAFIMYSSGSTGRPKGIIQQHGPLSFSIRHHSREMGITKDSRVLQFAAYTFDTSMSDIFGTFMQGAVLCVCSDWDRLNDLTASILSLRANYVCLTPTVAQDLDPVELPCLKTLCVGGEALTATLVDKWATKVDLINVYGITECLVWTFTTEPVKKFSRSIGRPSCGRAWIVSPDDASQLLPIGEVGELLIEGPNLALGYLNDALKSVETFIEAPAWLLNLRPQHPRTGKLYRTGDLVRYASDGTIDFLGRKDTQVKLNGQRVELGQVEYAMKRCLPDQAQIAALVVPDKSGSRTRLVAAICTRSTKKSFTDHKHGANSHSKRDCHPDTRLERRCSTDGQNQLSEYKNGDSKAECGEGLQRDIEFTKLSEYLRECLSKSLAELLIPKAFVPVERMPMTVSGKLDRRQLQDLVVEWLDTRDLFTSPPTDGKYLTPPSGEKEEQLATMWSHVLQVDIGLISANHEFVRVGGDSVAAMRLVSHARKNGWSLSVGKILQYQNLSQMAVIMERASGPSQVADIPAFALLRYPVATRSEIARQCDVPEAAVQDAYPCTPLQQGLLARSMTDPGSYVSRKIFDIPSNDSPQSWISAWERVYRSLDILRTRVLETKEGLIQAVIQEDLTWDEYDVAEQYLQKDRLRPMVMGEKLNKFAIVRTNSITTNAQLIWTSHHCTYDGWSEDLILQEVNHVYRGFATRTWPSFKSFVHHLQVKDHRASEVYWTEQLQGVEAPSFPCRTDPTRTTRVVQSVEKSVKFSLNNSFTASTIIRSALAILNTYYSNTDEALFGTVLSGRDVAIDGIETIVGPTFSTMPIRIQVERKASVARFLQQVQTQSIEMISHETLGLQRIQQLGEEARVACDFQCLLIVQPAGESVQSGGLKISYEETNDAGQYPLIIECKLGHGSASLQASHDIGVLDSAGAKRILIQLDCIIQGLLLADQNQLVEDIDPAGPADLSLIWTWNAEYPRAIDRCVHAIVGDMCALTPQKQAVCSWDGDFSYIQVDKLSSRLARKLQTLGVGPEIIVPVCFERSKWVIISILAINKAGGAFVLLNPSHPLDRLQGIVGQTNSKVLLSSEECYEISKQLMSDVLIIQQHLQQDQEPSCCESSPITTNGDISPASPISLLYVVFTSGTSGTPKGIMIENRAFCTYIEALARMTGAKSSWRGLVSSAYSFDSSLEEMLMPLMIGGTVCMPSQHEISNDLTGAMNRMGVHWGVFTPSLARLIDPRELTTLTDLYIGGEQMTDSLVHSYGSCVRLTNTYGPSECCPTGCVSSTPELYGGHIGRGVACRTWVVDPKNHERLMPVGCIGEMILDGPNVGRGYLLDPEKTRAAFIEPPQWLISVEKPSISNGVIYHPRRMYKTGDLVRYCSNGTLEYIGRKDQQVKLYGQRIELSEIEHHIKGLLASDADVIVEVASRDSKPDQQLLVAFVVFEDVPVGTRLSVANDPRIVILRQNLSQRLPSYMLPALYLLCHEIPLTTSDKVDRRSLKQLVKDLSEEEYLLAAGMCSEKRYPVADADIALQQLWADILKIDAKHIGLDDEFSRLGGDSVQAMRLAASARQQGWSLTVASITRFPSLEQMSEHMSRETNTDLRLPQPFSLLLETTDQATLIEKVAELCDVDQARIEDIYPCSNLQEGLIALSVKHPGTYMVEDVFEIPEAMDLGVLESGCNALLGKNEILRTRIVHTEGSFLQVVLKHESKREAVNKSGIPTSLRNMGLGQPLCYFAMLPEIPSGKRRLKWVIHHALYDGWSMALLKRQLDDFCNGLEMKHTAPYRLFIRHAMAIPNKTAMAFWKEKLANAAPIHFPEAPSATYFPRPDRTIEKILEYQQAFAPRVAMSIFVQAAWAIAVSRHTECRDVSFGTVVSGRTADFKGIEAVTGPTFATVPTIVRLHQDDTKSSLLQRLQMQAIDQIPYEQAGIKNIKVVSSEARDACAFQTILVIQPIEDEQSHSTNALVDITTDRSDITHYPLNLECQLTRVGLVMKASFDSSIVPEFKIHYLLAQFNHVMDQLCSTGECSINSISSTSDEDVAQIEAWNKKVDLQTSEACIHDVILARSRQVPLAEAICAWDGTFTYADLQERSKAFAQELRKLGVGPSSIVPILFNKSKWIVVATIAVLRSGAACVFLDSVNQPLTRMKTICEEVKANFVVCGDGCYDTAKLLDIAIIQLTPATVLTQCPTGDISLTSSTKGSDVAFIIFTSGTTGKPKGIVHEHRSLSSSYQALGKGIKLDCNSRVFQFAAFTFDMSVIDILSTLVHGGTVCIPSNEDRLNDIDGSFSRLRANEAFFTPSFARKLNPARFPGLRTLRLGGEAILKSDIDYWGPHVEVMTVSGPAEASLCTAGTFEKGKLAPPDIGNMINGISWITDLDDATKLAPIGVIGELMIEGPTIAREYLNQPLLTAKAFVKVPDWTSVVSPKPLKRLYRSGDLVRYNHDGSMQILGRRDGQVKIRGQRVELEEVELHVSRALASERNALKIDESAVEVVFTADDKETAYLAVFLALGKDWADTISTEALMALTRNLIQQMQTVLPPFMIPSAFIPVVEMPRTPSMKVDRTMLKTTASTKSREELFRYTSTNGTMSRTPSTAWEERVQRLWSSILHIDRMTISADDSFLNLGGDSLQAIAFVSAAREEDIDVTVADVFRHTQLRELAQFLQSRDTLPPPSTSLDTPVVQGTDQELVAQIWGSVPKLAGKEHDGIVRCTPVQHGVLDAQKYSSEVFQPEMRFTAMAACESVDIGLFVRAWVETVAQHDILRTVLVKVPRDSTWYQYILKKHVPEIHVVGDHRHSDNETEDLLQQSRQHLPAHQMFIQTQADGSLLCELHISHALLDGGCVDELLSHIKLRYRLSRGYLEQSPQYQQFQRYSEARPIEHSMIFWSQYLEGAKPCLLRLEDAISGCSQPLRDFRTEIVSLPKSSLLRSACQTHGVTLPTLIQSAWALTLRMFLMTDDVLFGFIVSNRDIDCPGIRQIVGPTFSVLVRRIHVSQNSGMREIMRICHDNWISCLPHQHLSFWEYHQRRTYGTSPRQLLFNTAINYRKFARPQNDREKGNEVDTLILNDIQSRDPFEFDVLLGIDDDDGEDVSAQLDFWASKIPKTKIHELRKAFECILQASAHD